MTSGRLFVNHPRLWLALLPRRTSASHKYAHGHALVLGGGMASSGAARMAARAALRAGAGLVTVVCPKDALAIYAAQLTAVMVAPFADDREFAQSLADPRRNAMLLGPGAGSGETLRRRVLRVLEAQKATVLDADALTSFQDQPQTLFDAIAAPCVLTPHDGEYKRLFAHEGDRLTRARGGRGAERRGDAAQGRRHRGRRARRARADSARGAAGAGHGGLGRRAGRHRARPLGPGHACARGGRRRRLAARPGRVSWSARD